jgi:DNA-directed RNA polymerase specialized sigma24 family protein
MPRASAESGCLHRRARNFAAFVARIDVRRWRTSWRRRRRRNENQIVVSGVRFTNTNSDPAMTAGLGLRFGKNLFAEGRLMYGFGDPKSTLIPITVGLRF